MGEGGITYQNEKKKKKAVWLITLKVHLQNHTHTKLHFHDGSETQQELKDCKNKLKKKNKTAGRDWDRKWSGSTESRGWMCRVCGAASSQGGGQPSLSCFSLLSLPLATARCAVLWTGCPSLLSNILGVSSDNDHNVIGGCYWEKIKMRLQLRKAGMPSVSHPCMSLCALSFQL